MVDRGIFQVKRSSLSTLAVAISVIVMIPIFIACVAVAAVGTLVLRLVTLPWTWYFYSANWGRLSKDRATTRTYAEQFQTTNLTVNNMLTYMDRSESERASARVPRAISFYPHKTKTVVCCIPFLGFYQNTEYTYPLLTALFMGMEEAGWKRKDVHCRNSGP